MEKRVEFLDALRGLAAMAVFAQHLLFPIAINPNLQSEIGSIARSLIIDYVNFGRFGVVLFFLLSGYVIPLSFRGAQPVSDFLVSRFFRLYPAYWISLIWTVGALYFTAGYIFPPTQIAANVTMVQKIFGQPDVNGVYWSLFIELFFYACCVVLFLARRLDHSSTLFALFSACVLATVLPIALNKFLNTHLPVQFFSHHLSFLLLGGLLRNAFTESRTKHEIYWGWMGILVFSIGVPFASGLVTQVSAAQVTHGKEATFAIAYVLALAAFSGSLQIRWPNHRLLLWFGTLSYSIYILHTGCIKIAEYIFPLTNTHSAIAYIALSVASTILLSWLIYETVEKRSISIGKHLRRQISKRMSEVRPGTPRV